MSGQGNLGTPWLWNSTTRRHSTSKGGVLYEIIKNDNGKWDAYADDDHLGTYRKPRQAARACVNKHRGVGRWLTNLIVLGLLGAWAAHKGGLL